MPNLLHRRLLLLLLDAAAPLVLLLIRECCAGVYSSMERIPCKAAPQRDALLTTVGESLLLGCSICPDACDPVVRKCLNYSLWPTRVRPNTSQEPILTWVRQTLDGRQESLSEATRQRIFIFQDVLTLRSTRQEDTGIYDCYWRGRLRRRWALTTVGPGDEAFREIYSNASGHPLHSDGRDRRLDNRTLPAANLEVYTRWFKWSRCSRCSLPPQPYANRTVAALENGSTVGSVRMRVGMCYVRAIHPIHPVRPVNPPVLGYYRWHGLPCRSHLLPVELKALRAIAYRPSELSIRRCYQKCKYNVHYKLFKVRMNATFVRNEFQYLTGFETKIVPYRATVKNGFLRFFGFKSYWTLKKIVPPRAPVRSFVMAKTWQRLAMRCPNRYTTRAPYHWFKMKTTQPKSIAEMLAHPLDPLTLFRRTRGRMKLDSGFNLVISQVRAVDKGKFICFHNNRMVGYVLLIHLPDSQMVLTGEAIASLMRLVMPLFMIFVTIIVAWKALSDKTVF